MKDNPITIGFDDATFELKTGSGTTHLIGVLCQGIRMIKVVKSEINIDGNDATENLIKLVKQNENIQYILTHTITFGGFNIVDLEEIYHQTGKPIIAVTEKKVDLDSVIKALKENFPLDYLNKIKNILNAGELYETDVNTAGGFSKVYFHFKGLKITEVETLLNKINIDSKLPECVRLAHLIGRIF
ncbi:MAG: DUF99 family protein [Candidatus Hodarchaeota archaeon]